MTTDLATTITDLTVDELLPIVSQSLEEEAIACDTPTAVKIGRSAGLATSGIYHVAGQAHTENGKRSWSAVVKVLGQPEFSRPGVDYEPMRELAVYRSGLFAELHSVRRAHCYSIDERDGLIYLWLEDLSSAPQPPWQPEYYVTTAHHFGQFNACWPEETLPQRDWLRQQGFRDSFRSPYYRDKFDRFLALQDHPLVRRAVPPDVLSRLLRLWEESDSLLALAEAAPKGVCHLDCHAKNLFPMRDPLRGDYTVAVDWTKVGISCYGIDMGHMLSSATKWLELPPNRAATLVGPVFDAYVAGLEEAGWSGDEAQVKLAYLSRLGCEAIRNVGILSRVASEPEAAARVAAHWRVPIENLCDQWADVHRFFLHCHDQAMDIARSHV